MELKDQFEQAVTDSKNLKERPGNEVLLQLYSLYKQALTGDINIEPPANAFDFVELAKYQAWSALKGKSNGDAMLEYINLVKKLKS